MFSTSDLLLQSHQEQMDQHYLQNLLDLFGYLTVTLKTAQVPTKMRKTMIEKQKIKRNTLLMET